MTRSRTRLVASAGAVGVFMGGLAGGTLAWSQAPAQGAAADVVPAADAANDPAGAAAPAAAVLAADTLAPPTPENVTGTADTTSVTLKWSPVEDTSLTGGGEPSGLSGYLIHRNWEFLAFVPAGTTTYTDNAAPGLYRYEVRAIDLSENISQPSPRIRFRVGDHDTTAPNAPTAVSATVAGDSATVTWTTSTDLPADTGIGISRYLIHENGEFRSFIPKNPALPRDGIEQMTFVQPLTAVGDVTLEVRAVDLDNNYSAPMKVVVRH